MTTPEVPGISHHPFSPFPICTSNCKLYVPRINLVKISHSQVNSLIICITFYLENFNANVPIMKMWDIATSNQGGWGLASYYNVSSVKSGFDRRHPFIYSTYMCLVIHFSKDIDIYENKRRK